MNPFSSGLIHRLAVRFFGNFVGFLPNWNKCMLFLKDFFRLDGVKLPFNLLFYTWLAIGKKAFP